MSSQIKGNGPQNSSDPYPEQNPAASKSNSIEIPQITLPKGGGALKNIDEKFEVNAANGTSSFSIPIPMTKSRSDFIPSLVLSYNSGAGNSEFGLGWNLSLPAIQRKTDKQLPKYFDSEESDIFMFSGVEDLVPKLNQDTEGNWNVDNRPIGNDFEVRRYIPRIEGGFSKIERIKPSNQNYFYWKVTSRDNVTTFFGLSENSRLSDPDNPNRVFKWLPELSYDDKGNCIQYEYSDEDLVNVPVAVHEKNRHEGRLKFTNKYLKKVLYGNRNAFYNNVHPFNPVSPSNPEYFFEVVFDYGEHTNQDNPYTVSNAWTCRYDSFSDYHSGFEIRTNRLCKRILLFHNFRELNDGIYPAHYLVKSLDLHYKCFNNTDATPEDIRNAEVEILQAVESVSYKKNPDGIYDKRSLPKIEFGYHELKWNRVVQNISHENIVNAPTGITGGYQWIDFYGEGISGIFTEQADAWYYKSNLGDGNFSIAQKVSSKPSFNGMSNGTLQMQDLNADGRKFIVSTQPGAQGYFEMNEDEESNWKRFTPFEKIPNVNIRDPRTKFIDLNGDGKPEVLVDEDNVFIWYPSEGITGYDSPELFQKPFDDEEGPRIVFADKEQTIFLADMNGDGMTDIARIRNGNISYWANMGYGKFSAKITMKYSPLFDSEDDFTPSHLHLFDISGTGATDIIYTGKNKLSAWLNLSGNSWSEGFIISNFPSLEKPNELSVVDLLGNGTGCLVWSSPLPANKETPMRYIDLMGGEKPYILSAYKNNLGKETKIKYKSSTQYYLEDKVNVKYWITKLPFPVQCVCETEVTEEITGVKFKSKYSYHHGYYDYHEREFRGFGRVEQTDTETYDDYIISGTRHITNRELYEPPILTKTWYHTGAFFNKEKILDQFKHEYFENTSFEEYHLPQPELEEGWTSQEYREALRACKGMVLRQEVYSQDGSDKENFPYTVAEHNCYIDKIQPASNKRFAVFIVKESEAVTYNYERNPIDPRIAHTLNLEIDELGNILQSASVVYGRQVTDNDLPPRVIEEQEKIHIIYTKNNFTNDIDNDNSYRLRVPCETIAYELTGIFPIQNYFNLDRLRNGFTEANEIGYEETATRGSIQIRRIEHQRILYYHNDLTHALPLGQLQSLGLPYETYRLAFTDPLIRSIYAPPGLPSRVDNSILRDNGYTHSNIYKTSGLFPLTDDDNEWWILSGKVVYPTNPEDHFYQPEKYIDPLGSDTKVFYYDDYNFFINSTEDAIGNTVHINEFDFRTLAPIKVTDINDNTSEIAIDILGMPVGMCVSGKNGEGDNLDGFVTDLTQVQINNFFDTPETHGATLLGNATSRFIYDFSRTNVITSAAATIVREEHLHEFVDNELITNEDSPVQLSFEYSDGFGKVVMKKVQAEPGLAKQLDANNIVIEVDTTPNLRWVGNGRTIFNNKGKPVKQFEPFFSVTHKYEDEDALVEIGVTPVMHYDSAGRLIKTELPNGTFSKVEFDSWKQKDFDTNDTVEQSEWYRIRMTGLLRTDRKEHKAAVKAAAHYDTPTVNHFDSLGRNIYSLAHNKYVSYFEGRRLIDEKYHTFIKLDIEGNQRSIEDARENTVMSYEYSMLGEVCKQISMDAGTRWIISNAMGKPVRKWDQRNYTFEFYYDDLHRPTESIVKGRDVDGIILNNIYDKIIYGENLLLPDRTNEAELQEKNILGQAIKHFDTAGLVETPEYDFKGSPKSIKRRLTIDYKNVVNWTVANLEVSLEDESHSHTFTTRMDALNRIKKQIAPDDSIITPHYNKAGVLKSEEVRQDRRDSTYIRNIDYDEKGQRTKIIYGNDVVTTFVYDEKTFRIKNIQTQKDNSFLQNLYYTYDAVGNITHIEDHAIPTIFYNNFTIEPVSEYTYDALYRLIEATGRECHESLIYGDKDNWDDDKFKKQYPNRDPMRMRIYTQRYKYDKVGNIEKMGHSTADGTGQWIRDYNYETTNNRLTSTQVSENGRLQRYTYDSHPYHGYITSMPHLQVMEWNFKEELSATSSQRRTDGGKPETTYYQYDSEGQRVRKITENSSDPNDSPTKKDERIYISGYEVYKQHSGPNASLERTTLSLLDNGHRFVLIETRIDDGSDEKLVRYQFTNHLGSACLELNESADVITYEEYHPYGTTAYQAKNSSIRSAAKRYRYTGMERDEETGLNYHSARYYVPWLGRWVSADPVGIGDGLNLYNNSHDNPNSFKDKSGTQALLFPEANTNPLLTNTPPIVSDFRNMSGQEQLNPQQSTVPSVLQPSSGVRVTSQRENSSRQPAHRTTNQPEHVFGMNLPFPPNVQLQLEMENHVSPFHGTLFSGNDHVRMLVDDYLNRGHSYNRSATVHQAYNLVCEHRNDSTEASLDLDQAAADHYLQARDQVFNGPLTPFVMVPAMILAVPGYELLKVAGVRIRTGPQPPSEPSFLSVRWGFTGILDGMLDWAIVFSDGFSASAGNH